MRLGKFTPSTKPRPTALIAILTFSLALAGCGGPKYTKAFQERLGVELAADAPMKLERLTTEEISGGKTESVFKFRGQFSVTEDLYEEVELPDDLSFVPALSRFDKAGQSAQGIAALHAIEELNVKIFRVVTPKGSRGELSGKARAALNNDGTWRFQIIEGGGGHPKGKRPPQGEKWLLDGSKEAKEHLSVLRTKIAALSELGAKAEKEASEARQKAEKEAREREEAFLADVAPGREIVGRWQGGEASGEIGMRFGEHTKSPEGYSIQGQLFAPAEPTRAKTFSGAITGDGTPENPYVLTASIPKSEGQKPDDAEMERTHNKTAGFLLPPSQFGLELRYSPEDGSFSGHVKTGNYVYDPNVARGPDRRKIPLHFNKRSSTTH